MANIVCKKTVFCFELKYRKIVTKTYFPKDS